MCKAANDGQDHRARAYMFSILFMLAVPGTLVTGIGFGLYRMNKNENASLGALHDPADPHAGPFGQSSSRSNPVRSK